MRPYFSAQADFEFITLVWGAKLPLSALIFVVDHIFAHDNLFKTCIEVMVLTTR